MKEEKITELEELVMKRSSLRNEIEMFNRIFEVGKENIGFQLSDLRQAKEYSYLHFLKDHFGFFDEALRKNFQRLKVELNDVQQRIDEL